MELIKRLEEEKKEYDRKLFKMKAILNKPDGKITPMQYDLIRRECNCMRQLVNVLTARIDNLRIDQ